MPKLSLAYEEKTQKRIVLKHFKMLTLKVYLNIITRKQRPYLYVAVHQEEITSRVWIQCSRAYDWLQHVHVYNYLT